MRKKLIKLIEAGVPRLYDAEGEVVPKKQIAAKILDVLPFPERLDLGPFETWIPFRCAGCFYNQGISKGCVYEMFNEKVHMDQPVPDDCPNGY